MLDAQGAAADHGAHDDACPSSGPLGLARIRQVSRRYEGHADWYDALRFPAQEDGSARLLAPLLGPADPGNPICLHAGAREPSDQKGEAKRRRGAQAKRVVG